VSATDPHHATHRTIEAIWRIESAHVIAGPTTHNLSFILFVRKFTTRQRYVASRLPPCVNCCEQAIALIDHWSANSQLVQWRVGVEKLNISEIRGNLGDRKCRAEQRKSFVGHPDAF